MKFLWRAFLVIALANLFGIVGSIGWLLASDRLSIDRVRQIRQIVSTTVSEETAETEAADAAEAAETEAAERETILAGDPGMAGERIADQNLEDEQHRQRFTRREQEIRMLAERLDTERAEVDRQWDLLQQEKDAFATYRENLRQTEGTEQFQRALKTLEGQKPKAAMTMLQSLMTQGKTEEVVTYLDAMADRSRTKVLAEFEKSDPAVAAGLLEDLRTLGVELEQTDAADPTLQSADASP